MKSARVQVQEHFTAYGGGLSGSDKSGRGGSHDEPPPTGSAPSALAYRPVPGMASLERLTIDHLNTIVSTVATPP